MATSIGAYMMVPGNDFVAWYCTVLGGKRGLRVLDCGAGDGCNGLWLRDRFGCEVTMFDKNGGDGVVQRGEVGTFPAAAGAWDLVLDVRCLTYVGDVEWALQRCAANGAIYSEWFESTNISMGETKPLVWPDSRLWRRNNVLCQKHGTYIVRCEYVH